MSVKDHYQDVIDEIIAYRGLVPLVSRPTSAVLETAEFDEVLLHTDWFVHRGDSRPHYRYRRYRELLDYLETSSEGHMANVDIGSGAGVFSWIFLDWAADLGLKFDHVDLYGFDHSEAMRELAQLVRSGLTQYISGYPALHYSCDLDDFLQQLTENHAAGTGYVITLGHVLAQTFQYRPGDIGNYARIIVHVCKLLDDASSCVLIAADARRASPLFIAGWNLLLQRLTSSGIEYEHKLVWNTAINDDSRAKRAVLSPS